MSYPFRIRSAHRPGLKARIARTATAVAGGLALASVAHDAQAQSTLDDTDVEAFGAAGLFVTYAFGAEQGLGFAVDARLGAHEVGVVNCEEEDAGNHPYGGGALRFEWYPTSHMRLLILGLGGSTFGTTLGAHGELGAGYRWGDDGGFDTVIGAELDYSVAAAALRFDPTRLELSPAVGLVVPPMSVWADTGSCWIAGRPRRTDEGVAPLPALGFDAARARTRPSDAPPEAVRIWGVRARTEWASVPAFTELAEQLRAVGAPAPLITRCYAAFADEVRHAMLSGGHCAQLGDGRVMLERNAIGTRAPLDGRAGLVRLAVESWVDGCLGEGSAAACADEEARITEHPGIRATQAAIAHDEGEHAELAWDVLQWALTAGGDDVRGALHVAAQAAPSEPPAGPSDLGLTAYGIASRDAHAALADQHRARCLARLDRLLAA